MPIQAASPALVLVGALMMTQARKIDWNDLEVAIPAFLTIVLMPFTYSITNGVGAGLIAYTVIKAARGKFREIRWLMWVVTAVFVCYFALNAIEVLAQSKVRATCASCAERTSGMAGAPGKSYAVRQPHRRHAAARPRPPGAALAVDDAATVDRQRSPADVWRVRCTSCARRRCGRGSRAGTLRLQRFETPSRSD